jgi:hypothetical protein
MRFLLVKQHIASYSATIGPTREAAEPYKDA